MWRKIFFTSGLFVVFCGVMLLFVDRLVLKAEPELEKDEEFEGLFSTLNEENRIVVDPPDWTAFSLMSIGTVTGMYSIALPRR